jgi:hypothetical protein
MYNKCYIFSATECNMMYFFWLGRCDNYGTICILLGTIEGYVGIEGGVRRLNFKRSGASGYPV